MYRFSAYIFTLVLSVGTPVTVAATEPSGSARVSALEAMLLKTQDSASQAAVLSELYDALGDVIQLEVDGVRYRPVAIEACAADTFDLCYQRCGFRHERVTGGPIKVSPVSIVKLGSASPDRKRLREGTSDWVAMLLDDAAFKGPPADPGPVWWDAEGRVDMKHLGPEHRFLQVLVRQQGGPWVEKVTWILDRGFVPREVPPVGR